MWGWCGRAKSTLLAGRRKQLMPKLKKKNQVLAAYACYLEIWKAAPEGGQTFGSRLPLRNRAERGGQRSAMFFYKPSGLFQLSTCIVLIKIHLMLEN